MGKEEAGLLRDNDGHSNTQPPKQPYCRPVLVSHGRLQGFTAAVSGQAIPSKGPTSDLRLKTQIQPLQDGALARVMALHPVAFSSIETGDRRAGFLTKEVEAVMSQAVVRSGGSDRLHIDYSAMISLLTKAIQELQSEAAELRERAAER